MKSEFVMRPLDPARDAEKLAAMWNASDDQWPGTWSSGVPITPTMVKERLDRENRMEASVWDDGEVIAGYCSVWKDPEEAGVAYIALINVAPQFQGQSFARKSLVHWVSRITEMGFTRLDLHTWPGNLKAVPLYKKTGFNWMPDADSGGGVHMLNFIPAILKTPLLQPFFANNDWYEALRRELNQSEDDERWEGMKVFTYRFDGEGGPVSVWADRLARTITAIETPDLSAAAVASEIEPPRGLTTSIRWRLSNRSSRTMKISLVASGSDYLSISHQEAFDLRAGDSVELAGKVEVAAEVSDLKVRKGKPMPAVKTILVVDGKVLELGTGMRPRRGVEVSTDPIPVTVAPGVARECRIQLRSRLKRAVEATVSIVPAAGLKSDWTQRTISLDGEGFAGLPVVLEADKVGAYEFPVSVEFAFDGQSVRVPPEPRSVFSVGPGDLVVARAKHAIRVENQTLRVIVSQEGAYTGVHDVATGSYLGGEMAYAAPPVKPSEFWQGIFDLSYERLPEGVIVKASMASRDNPGLVLTKRVKVSSGNTIVVSYEFENLGTGVGRYQLYQSMHTGGGSRTVVLPLAEGLAIGPPGEFPGAPDEEFKKPSSFAEPWLASETKRATVGFIWPADTVEIYRQWGTTRLTQFYEAPPQTRLALPPLLIYAGPGDWREVRRTWQRVAGQKIDAYRPEPEATPYLSARLEPAVALSLDGEVKRTLMVENRVPRKLSGTARLQLPDGWECDSTEFEFSEVNWQKPHSTTVAFTSNAPPGAAAGKIEIRSKEFDRDVEIPFIRLGDGSAVSVEELQRSDQRVLVIDNGRMSVEVLPDFAASVGSLIADDVNHLYSAFPKVATLGWLSPWHGGLSPFVMTGGNFPGKLWEEEIRAEQVTATDGLGLVWTGVRQRAELTKDEDSRGVQVEVDILTVGGSPVIKLVLRLLNLTSAVRHISAGWGAFVQPGGSRESTLLVGPDHSLKPTDRILELPSGAWAAAHNPDNGATLVLVSPVEAASGLAWGADGSHLFASKTIEVPADGGIEFPAYLALAPSLESARRFEALRNVE